MPSADPGAGCTCKPYIKVVKIRSVYYLVIAGLLVGVTAWLCKIDGRGSKDSEIRPPGEIRKGGKPNDALNSGNRTKRVRSLIARQRKSEDFYIWKARNLKPDEAKETVEHAFEDLDENELSLFIGEFWKQNMASMNPGEIIKICESHESIDGKPSLYRSLFGRRSSMTDPEELEKSKKIAQLVPPESQFRQIAFNSYYQALVKNCDSIDDFTALVRGLPELKMEEDREGARNAIAGSIGMKIDKEPEFLELVREWDIEDDVKRRVLIFHPIDGILR